VLFPHYRFEHPVTGRTIRVTTLGYVAAALTGPVFVAALGRRVRGVLMSVLVTGIYMVGVLLVIGGSTYTTAANGIIMLVFLIPVLIALHARSTVFVLREDLRRRGWMVSID
jgi:hypothetical protein